MRFFFVLCEKTLTQSRSVRLQALPDRDCQSRRDDETEFLPVLLLEKKEVVHAPRGPYSSCVFTQVFTEPPGQSFKREKKIYTLHVSFYYLLKKTTSQLLF